jgi:hypothetical protein
MTAEVDNTTAAKRDERPTRVTGEKAVDQSIYISLLSIRVAIIFTTRWRQQLLFEGVVRAETGLGGKTAIVQRALRRGLAPVASNTGD